MNKRIIYTTPEGGVAVIIPTGELSIEEVYGKDVPFGVEAEIVDVSAVPSDRTFRAAWEVQGKAIGHNMDKAQAISHEKRRAAREVEFAPLDAVIAKQIPGKDATEAEGKRQAVRDKYAVMQTQIDTAQTVDQLKAIITGA